MTKRLERIYKNYLKREHPAYFNKHREAWRSFIEY